MSAVVDVIIATTCEASRRQSLFSAIESVLTQQIKTNVIAVVNGSRINGDCLAALRSKKGVTVVEQAVGSYPLALRTGREVVTAPFYAFLDDDDEYLPGAVERRIAPLLADPTLGFVASNGLRRLNDIDYPVVKRPRDAQLHPLVALTRENWLASCGGLFRTESIGVEYFDGRTAHLEWTFLAYKLAITRTLAFVDEPTFIINDSAGSLSKSKNYADAEAQVLPRILDLELPIVVRRALKQKLGRCLHNIAARKTADGQWIQAWRYHLTSISYPGGWRYLMYSRKLLIPLPRPRQ